MTKVSFIGIIEVDIGQAMLSYVTLDSVQKGHGENDFVASTKRFVNIASANQNR